MGWRDCSLIELFGAVEGEMELELEWELDQELGMPEYRLFGEQRI